MVRVMNIVFGIGIAIILFIVVMLGTQVFYEEPRWDDFNCTYPKEIITTMELCPDNISVLECRDLIKTGTGLKTNTEEQQVFEECNKRFSEAEKEYGKILFVINCVAGIILVIISLYLFSMVNIAAGTAFAGLALIIYGFIRGWQGIGDILKFCVALIVTILFITFAVIINKRYSRKTRE